MSISHFVAALAIAAAVPAHAAHTKNVDFAGLTKVSGNNVDFFYDAGLYKSASVSGDELRLGLGLQGDGGFAAMQKVIAVAHNGVTLKAQINSSLQGNFNLAANTGLLARNNFSAYFADYAGGQLVWDDSKPTPVAGLKQDYIWDRIGSPYQGDLSSSIFPINDSVSAPLSTSAALLLDTNYLLDFDTLTGSRASVDYVTYGFEVLTPGTLPPVPGVSTSNP